MRRQRFFNGRDKAVLRGILQDNVGYIPSNAALCQAFRRSSYCMEEGGKSNEMFEFIGDQVLSFYTVKIISQRCCAVNLEGDFAFRIRQHKLSGLKQQLLSNENFAKIIDDWAVAEYLIVGRDDERNEVDKQTKIKADLFEAIIGAIAMDCNWNSEILENVVNKALGLDSLVDRIIQEDFMPVQFDMENAVTKLKELAEKEQISQPSYNIDQIGGPAFRDKAGDPIWACNIRVINDITGISLVIYATSKKEAKKAAAYLALCEHFQVPNKYGVSQKCISWIYKNGSLMPGSPEL